MQYESEIEVQTPVDRVITKAAELLVAEGFSIVQHSHKEVQCSGPGMRSTKQNPILGATSVVLIERTHPKPRVIVHAELGGVEWMSKFILRLPLAIAGGQAILFGSFALVGNTIFGAPVPPSSFGLIIGILALVTVPWIFIRPRMTRWMKKRTEASIEALVRNADHLTQRDQLDVAS